MTPRIEHIEEKYFVGISLTTSLTDDKTFKVFSQFMPQRKHIKNNVTLDIYDIRVFGPDYYLNFNPSNSFEKWALVEVFDHTNIPSGMQSFILKAGNYAVFTFDLSKDAQNCFEYIFTKWLPNSEYNLDNRPHFDILTEDIQKKISNALSEIWIPIRDK